MTSLLLPQTFSRYRSIASLGRGGMAEVILAEMRVGKGVTRLAVLKRIWSDLATDAEVVSMFLREARESALMNHPNVAQTYEVLEHAKRPAVAMEYLDGQPLTRVMDRLLRSGGLTLTLRLRILANVLAGLDYAHNLEDFDGTPLGVVHRDLNPQNVVVTYDGQVKLVDFGLAKSLFATRQTGREAAGGGDRVSCIAPEQLWGTRIDRRADVFSAGVMLWEMLAGRRLWLGLSEATIIRHLMSRAPIRALPTDAHPPEGLARVCARALAIDPEMRFGSAAEFAAEIERLVPGSDDSHARHLGKIVSLAFAQERAARRALIETHVRAHRPGAEKENVISHQAPRSHGPSDHQLQRLAAPALPPRLPPPFRFGDAPLGGSSAAIWGEDDASASGGTLAIDLDCIVSIEPLREAAEGGTEQPAEELPEPVEPLEPIEPVDEALPQTRVYQARAVRRPWKSVIAGFSVAMAILLGAGGLWAGLSRSAADTTVTSSPASIGPNDRPAWGQIRHEAPTPLTRLENVSHSTTTPVGSEYSDALPLPRRGRDHFGNHATISRTVHSRSRMEDTEVADDRSPTRDSEAESSSEQNEELSRDHERIRHHDDDILPPSEEMATVNSLPVPPVAATPGVPGTAPGPRAAPETKSSAPVGLVSTLGRSSRTRRPIDTSDPFNP